MERATTFNQMSSGEGKQPREAIKRATTAAQGNCIHILAGIIKKKKTRKYTPLFLKGSTDE